MCFRYRFDEGIYWMMDGNPVENAWLQEKTRYITREGKP
jgi:hypothetical protein